MGPASFHDLDTDVYARPEANGRILAGDGTELVRDRPGAVRGGGGRIVPRPPGGGARDLVPRVGRERRRRGVGRGLHRHPRPAPVHRSGRPARRSLLRDHRVQRVRGDARWRGRPSAGRADRRPPDSATAAAALGPCCPARFGGAAPLFSPVPGSHSRAAKRPASSAPEGRTIRPPGGGPASRGTRPLPRSTSACRPPGSGAVRRSRMLPRG